MVVWIRCGGRTEQLVGLGEPFNCTGSDADGGQADLVTLYKLMYARLILSMMMPTNILLLPRATEKQLRPAAGK
jgi:hypothetical protein